MLDLGIMNAFTHLFKERRWWLKLGIISAVSFAATGTMTLVQRLSTSTITDSALSSRSITNLALTTGLVAIVISYSLLGIFSLFSAWYTYENTQAAIQKRNTKLIWEYSLMQSIKRVGKYLLVNLVYGWIVGVFTIIFVGIPVFVLVLLILAKDGNYSASTWGTPGMALLLILLCCVVVFAVIVLSVLSYLFVTPAYLRLYATNTFSEAFKFSSNFRLAKKYFWYFMLVIVLSTLYMVCLGAASMFVGFIVGILLPTHPNILLGLEVLVQLPLSIISAYFTFFVYTRILGNLYRGIIEREEELRFIR